MSAQCVRCGRPTDGTVCRSEALSLAEKLQTAAGHAEDAEAVLTRQARYGAGSRGGSDEPLPVDLTASARLAAVENTIGGWARIVVEERGTELPARRPTLGPVCPDSACGHASCDRIRHRRPPARLAEAARWLATQVEWLRQHPAAGEAFTELHDACDQLARLVDRPADKHLVGMCDCGKVLYAAHGRTAIRCPQPTCRLVWNVTESRDILRGALRGKLFTAAEGARLAAHWDERASEQIRKLINKWAERGRLIPHGAVDDGPTFLFGDVLDKLTESPPRRAVVAA